MKYMSFRQLVLTFAIAFLGSAFQDEKAPAIIEGKVISQNTGQPVADAYLYVIAGEEETVTLADGRFILKTWQKLPARCTIEHKNFERQVLLISQQGKISVKLQQK